MRRIAGLRADAEMTQEELAKEFGVTVQTVRNWEKKQPDLTGSTIIKLCTYFDVSADELLGID